MYRNSFIQCASILLSEVAIYFYTNAFSLSLTFILVVSQLEACYFAPRWKLSNKFIVAPCRKVDMFPENDDRYISAKRVSSSRIPHNKFSTLMVYLNLSKRFLQNNNVLFRLRVDYTPSSLLVYIGVRNLIYVQGVPFSPSRARFASLTMQRQRRHIFREEPSDIYR